MNRQIYCDVCGIYFHVSVYSDFDDHDKLFHKDDYLPIVNLTHPVSTENAPDLNTLMTDMIKSQRAMRQITLAIDSLIDAAWELNGDRYK